MNEYIEDYVLASAVSAKEQAQAAASVNVSISGSVAGQIAIYDGAAFYAGGLEGDSNGVAVSLVVSPSLKLLVSLSQDLKSTGSPTFANVTISTSLSVGGGTTLFAMTSGSFSVNPASIAANSRGSVDITVSGLAVGDLVLLSPPDGLNSGLIYGGCRVTAVDTLRIYLANLTGSPIDDGSLTWNYLHFGLS